MKRPKILDVDVTLVDNAVTLWRAGAVVAIPTETVYGLGADATNGQAVAKIYALKSRPQFNPLIVHVADVATAKKYVEWNDAAETLATKFWPGPLTLVLKRKSPVASHQSPVIHELVSAGGDTLAIRMPSHPIALQLLKVFGGGIAAPSANRSGRVSPTTAQHVRDEFGDSVPLIIDGGACEVGLESTVLDLTGDVPVILRPGAVTREMIEEVVSRQPVRHSPKGDDGSLVISKKEKSENFSTGGAVGSAGINRDSDSSSPRRGEVGRGAECGRDSASSQPPPVPSPSGGGSQALRASPVAPLSPILKSPGQLESHYAPSIPVRLNATDVAEDEALLAFGPAPLMGAATTLNLSEHGDLIEAAANLFAYLRALDNGYHRAIAVMPIPNEGLGEAMMDRLRRAAVR